MSETPRGLAERRKELLDGLMRDAIYRGAVAVLTQHGLEGATMDRVAAAAGVAKGSLYNYFRDKRELLEFVHSRAVAPMQVALGSIVQSGLPAPEKLGRICRLWREYLAENHPVFEFLVNDHTARGLLRGSEQTARSAGIAQIAKIIQQGIQEGTFRPVDPVATAQMFVGAGIIMMEEEMAEGRQRGIDEAVEAMLGVFLHGLVGEQAGQPFEQPGSSEA